MRAIVPARTDHAGSSRSGASAALIRPSDLGRRVQVGLRDGWRAANYRSEEALDFAVLASARHRGFNLTDVINSYIAWGTLRTPGATKQSVRGGDRLVTHYLTKRWKELAAASDRHACTLQMAALREQVYTMSLRGRGGPAERAVLSVIADAATMQATSTPHVGRLDFIILTGLDEHSVNDALHRLLAASRLLQQERGTDVRRSTWMLCIPSREAIPGRSTKDSTPVENTLLGLVPPPCLDLFRVLGLPSWEVYTFLIVNGEATADFTAHTLGRHVKTVRKHLNGLAALSLVERMSDGSWRLGAVTLKEATTAAGADGAADQHELRALSRAVRRRAWLDARDRAVASVRESAARRATRRPLAAQHAPPPVHATLWRRT